MMPIEARSAVRKLDIVSACYRAVTNIVNEQDLSVTITALFLTVVYNSERLGFSILMSYWYPKLNATYQLNTKLYNYIVDVIKRYYGNKHHVGAC